jgi:hypothetical protein
MSASRPLLVVLGLLFLPAAVRAEAPSRLGPDRIYDAQALLAQTAAEPAPGLEAPTPSTKNSKLAMLYSLVLPGLGELYLGHKGRATAFFAVEGAIWTSYIAFQSQGGHRKDLYQEFAEVRAGAARKDDDEYYRVIGNYISSDGPFSANEGVRRQARALYPNNPAEQQAYYEEHAYTGDDSWNWFSEADLDRYKDMRTESLDAYQKADYSLGAAVANRLLSIIDVGILGAQASHDEDEAEIHMNMTGGREGPGAQLVLSRSF